MSRYSTGTRSIGEAKKFSWEYAVPENDFWNTLDFVVCRNFLKCFEPEAVASLPLDSKLGKTEKLELLLGILQEELTRLDKTASPQTLYEVDFQKWDAIMLGIFTMHMQLDQNEVNGAAEKTIAELVARRKDRSNMSHLHSLAGLLNDQGRYKEAEETERQVLKWLDEKLGPHSPQALGSRRMIARSLCLQDPPRREEARGMFAEVGRLVAGLGRTEFAVYEEQQRDLTRSMMRELGMAGEEDESW